MTVAVANWLVGFTSVFVLFIVISTCWEVWMMVSQMRNEIHEIMRFLTAKARIVVTAGQFEITLSPKKADDEQ